MKILKCTLKHLDLIYEAESILFPEDMRDTRPCLTSDIKNGYYYGLFDEDILLGHFCIYLKEGLYLSNLVIFPKYQGLNYSKIIIQYLKQYIIMNSIDRVWLHVSIHNDIAIGLYNKCGFKIKGNIKDFYALNEDALIMEFK